MCVSISAVVHVRLAPEPTPTTGNDKDARSPPPLAKRCFSARVQVLMTPNGRSGEHLRAMQQRVIKPPPPPPQTASGGNSSLLSSRLGDLRSNFPLIFQSASSRQRSRQRIPHHLHNLCAPSAVFSRAHINYSRVFIPNSDLTPS